MDDYIWTSERFRVIRVFSEVPGGYGNTRKKQWALMGLSGKDQEVARTPPKPSPNWTRGLGCGPLSLPSPLPPFPPSPSWTRKGGNLLQLGVGILLPWRSPPRAGLLPCSFIYGGRGTPWTHKLIFVIVLLAVCGAPLHHNPR